MLLSPLCVLEYGIVPVLCPGPRGLRIGDTGWGPRPGAQVRTQVEAIPCLPAGHLGVCTQLGIMGDVPCRCLSHREADRWTQSSLLLPHSHLSAPEQSPEDEEQSLQRAETLQVPRSCSQGQR